MKEKKPRWKTTEVALLKSLAGNTRRHIIAKRLKRNESAVRMMASRLGISLKFEH